MSARQTQSLFGLRRAAALTCEDAKGPQPALTVSHYKPLDCNAAVCLPAKPALPCKAALGHRPGACRPVLAVTTAGRLAKRPCSPQDCFPGARTLKGEGFWASRAGCPIPRCAGTSPLRWGSFWRRFYQPSPMPFHLPSPMGKVDFGEIACNFAERRMRSLHLQVNDGVLFALRSA